MKRETKIKKMLEKYNNSEEKKEDIRYISNKLLKDKLLEMRIKSKE